MVLAHAWSVQRVLRFSFRQVKSPTVPMVRTGLKYPAAHQASDGRSDSDGSKLQKEHAMASNVYVGNLTFNTTSADLQALFGAHGEVKKAMACSF